MAKISPQERLMRQRAIISLVARGYRLAEIGEILGMSKRTVREEVGRIEKSEDEQLMRFTLDAFRRNVLRRDEELRKCAWKLFDSKETPVVQKVALLRFLSTLDVRISRQFEALGFMDSESIDGEEGYEHVSQEELKALGDEILQSVYQDRANGQAEDSHA